MRGLTEKQRRFIEEYLVDLNATAAYRRAGYKARGNAAETNASRMLRNAQVAKAIRAAKRKRAARTELNQDWVITRLKKEAEKKDKGASHGARVRALHLLGLHLGMFAEKRILEGGEKPIPVKHDHTFGPELVDQVLTILLSSGALKPGVGKASDAAADKVHPS